jgi:hypothetical protein
MIERQPLDGIGNKEIGTIWNQNGESSCNGCAAMARLSDVI